MGTPGMIAVSGVSSWYRIINLKGYEAQLFCPVRNRWIQVSAKGEIFLSRCSSPRNPELLLRSRQARH